MPLTPDKARALDALITRFNNSGGSGVTKEQFAAELSSLGVTAADLAAYSQIRSGPWLAALPGVMALLVAGGGVRDAFTDPNKKPRTGATDIIDDAPNVVGSSGNAAAGGAQNGGMTPQNIVESYLAQGYTRDNVNPNILFKWVDDPQNPGAKKMDMVNIASILPGGGAGGGGGIGRTRTIINNHEGRALIIDENGNTVGENTDLFKPPEPKAPDQWYNADNGSVFEFKDGKWERNALLSTNKAGTVQVNHDTGLAYQWDNKAGQWARAAQFDANPTVSPAQTRADEQRKFDLVRADNLRSEQNAAAATTRGQDFSLAGVLGNLALQDSKFFSDSVSRGSDYIHRAYKQRGGTSPLPMVTNADLINSLAGGRAAAQATLDQLAAARPAFNFAAPAPLATPLPSAPAPTVSAPSAPAASQVSGGFDQAANNAAIVAAAQRMGIATPGFAHGTKGTKARKFIVGDPQVANVPNVEMVTVHKPGKDTTVEVEPMHRPLGEVPRFAFGTDSGQSGSWGQKPGFGNWQTGQPLTGRQVIGDWWDEPTGSQRFGSISGNGVEIVHAGTMRTPEQQALADAWNRGSFNSDPSTHGKTFAQWMQGGGPRSLTGYTATANTAPKLPTPSTVSQEDLVRSAKEMAGPAITGLMSGGTAPPLRFNFAVAAPQQYANLTTDERDALNSYLGVVENTSLADVEQNARQLFGRTGTGYGARRSFALR